MLHTRVVTGHGGGPEKTILNSPRFLAEYGIDCACLFMRSPDDEEFADLETKGAALGAEVIGVDDRGPLDLRVIRDCVRICRERNVDVWHAHDYKSNAMGLLVRLFHPMQLVTTAHGWVQITARTPTYYRIDRFCMKRYQHVIAVSQDLHDACSGFGLSAEKLTLIDNAIVLEDYDPSPSTTAEKQAFGFLPETILLGAVGRLSEEKGFDRLIDAVARIIGDGHNVGLVIAGEGHLRETLQDQIDSLGMQNHIRLSGFLNDPRTLYRAIDVFVLSSLREGLPNVVLEAMASQRPVVTTNVNGIPRLVQHGENGLVVGDGSGELLYQGLLQCVVSRELRRRLAQAGRHTVEQRFCFSRRMQRIVNVYQSLGIKLPAAHKRRSESDQMTRESVPAMV